MSFDKTKGSWSLYGSWSFEKREGLLFEQGLYEKNVFVEFEQETLF